VTGTAVPHDLALEVLALPYAEIVPVGFDPPNPYLSARSPAGKNRGSVGARALLTLLRSVRAEL
jgi:hypothetical protein